MKDNTSMLFFGSLRSSVPYIILLLSLLPALVAAPVAAVDSLSLVFPAPASEIFNAATDGRIAVPGGLTSGQSCTIVYAAGGDIALAGSNEDGAGLFAKIHFLPASEGKFGRVYFGFDVVRFPQGGMNELGLFFDAATAESVDVPRDPSKSDSGREGPLILKAMEECSTVEEVLEYFERYDCSGRWGGQYLIGDRFGNSAIIEPMTVIRKKGRCQVVTNFLQSRNAPEMSQDPRYRLASKLLEESDGFSIDVLRRVLNATHWEEYSGSMTVTLYSYICDLTHGEIYIYNFHDFEQAARINLRDELAKGESLRTIASLFPYETFAERRYKAWRIVGLLHERAVESGLEGPDGVLAYYRELVSGDDEFARYEVSESQLNALGYLLLNDGITDLAIGILELNVSEHPESPNVYDSLGEAYMKAGNKEKAISNYERSLELDPDNRNAEKRLRELKQ